MEILFSISSCFWTSMVSSSPRTALVLTGEPYNIGALFLPFFSFFFLHFCNRKHLCKAIFPLTIRWEVNNHLASVSPCCVIYTLGQEAETLAWRWTACCSNQGLHLLFMDRSYQLLSTSTWTVVISWQRPKEASSSKCSLWPRRDEECCIQPSVGEVSFR